MSAAGTGGSRSIPREQPSLEAVQMLTGALGMQLALAPWWGRGLLAVGSSSLAWKESSTTPPRPPLPSWEKPPCEGERGQQGSAAPL